MRDVRARFPFTRLVPLAAAALLAVGLAACGSSSPPAALSKSADAGCVPRDHDDAAAPTTRSDTTTTTAPPGQEIGFSPYTPQGAEAQGLQVTQKASGRCTSPGVAGSASYRCTAQPGAVAYDPCFAPPLATKGPLLCVPDPTDMDVTQFSTDALPKASAHTPLTPGVGHAPAQRSGVHTGARHMDGRGPFACPTPTATNSLADCHAPEPAAQGWATSCQAKQDASSPFSVVSVLNVWN